MMPEALMAACSAAAVQLAAVPLPTTRAPLVLVAAIGAVQTAVGAASAAAVAAAAAAPIEKRRAAARQDGVGKRDRTMHGS